MKHLFSLTRFFAFLLIFGVLVPGCNSGDSNPVASGIGAGTAANLAGPVTFKVILPDSAGQAASTVPLMSSIRAVDVTAPTVTFKLILVNTGNSGAPTSTMIKTAAVSESGAAETTFTSVPAGTCIGDIHIEGGNIDSYSDFHGAIDLVAGVANTLYVTPKGSKLQPDFVAYVIEQVVATPVLFGKALPGLTSQVIQAIAGLDKSKSTAYSDAIMMFAKYVNLTIQVSTTAKTITYNGNGNDAGSVPVDTNSYGAGEVVTLARNTGNLYKSGYYLAGWNTQADGLGTTYAEGSTLQLGNENITLFAKWGGAATLTLSRLFPAGTLAGNLRAATTISLNYSDLFMFITVNGTKIKMSYKKHTNKAAGMEVEFAAPVLPEIIEAVKGTAVSVEVMLQPAGITQPVVFVPAQAITIPSTLTSGTTAFALESTPISTVRTDAEILTAIKTENPTISDPVIASDFVVASIMFGSTSLSTDKANPTVMLTATSYVFTATINQSYANIVAPTFQLQMNNVTDNTSVILTGAPYVTVAWDSTKKIATITFTPSSSDSNYRFESGKTYSFSLLSTDAYGTANVRFTLPATYYIRAL